MEPPTPSLNRRQTRIFVVLFLAAILGVALTAGWIILRAQNDPESRQRIERLNAIRDSAQAVQDSLNDALRNAR